MLMVQEYASGVMECVDLIERGFRLEGWPRVEKARPKGKPELLDKFQEMNPHLMETPDNDKCFTHWDLLTAQHRDGLGHCFDGWGDPRWEYMQRYFEGEHRECWEDDVTGLVVITGHPNLLYHCLGSGRQGDDCEGFEHQKYGFFYLRDRGLAYSVSNGSWYSDASALVVIARRDVLERVKLPTGSSPDPTEVFTYGDFFHPWQSIEKTCRPGKLRNGRGNHYGPCSPKPRASSKSPSTNAATFCTPIWLEDFTSWPMSRRPRSGASRTP